MRHNEAVNVIATLYADLAAGDTSAKLVKYANAHDLAPAVLQKLGQVYNTALTVTTLEKAASRDAHVDLLDVPKMISDYITLPDTVEKKASATTKSATHSVANLNISALLGEVARGNVRPIEKQAAEIVVLDESPVEIQAGDAGTLASMVLDARLDCEKSAADLVEALAILNPAEDVIDVADMQRDAELLVGNKGCIKSACDFLDRAAASRRIKRTIARRDESETLYKRAFVTHTHPLTQGFLDLIDKVAHAHVTKEAALGLKKGKGIEDLVGESEADAMARQDAESDRKGADYADRKATESAQNEVADLLEQSISVPGDDPAAIEDSSVAEELTTADAEPEAAALTKDDVDADTYTAIEDSTDADQQAAPDTMIEDVQGKKDKPGVMADLATAASRNMAALADNVGSAAVATVKGPLDTLGMMIGNDRTNAAQRDLDEQLGDIERTVNIRRLILTDPVLRELPPEKVVSVYNSIAQANPEAAEDPNLMKLALREAVSYEGLTTDSYKQLVDTRKAKLQGDKAKRDNDSDDYKIKGTDMFGRETSR